MHALKAAFSFRQKSLFRLGGLAHWNNEFAVKVIVCLAVPVWRPTAFFIKEYLPIFSKTDLLAYI